MSKQPNILGSNTLKGLTRPREGLIFIPGQNKKNLPKRKFDIIILKILKTI